MSCNGRELLGQKMDKGMLLISHRRIKSGWQVNSEYLMVRHHIKVGLWYPCCSTTLNYRSEQTTSNRLQEEKQRDV